MAIIMFVFAIYLIYVSYFKVVCLLFRGKQHNRFFGTFLNTVVPVVGSLPVVLMASKYERRTFSPASKMNEDILRYCTIALQMISVFMLFLPFLHSEGTYTDGVNLIYGQSIAGNDVLRPSSFMIYLVIAPFVGAVLNIADRRYNFRNVLSYWISLILCLSMLALFIVVGTDGITTTLVFWIYCFVNVTIMLLSIFSLVVVRNRQLLAIEQEEKAEYIKMQKEKNKGSADEIDAENTYRCAKCGNLVKKGMVCECITSHKNLDNVMKQSVSESASSRFCVYCKKILGEDEVCDCQGDGFAISVKQQDYVGRKCKYCGQQLVGESICVCEKIMKNSEPVDDAELPVSTPVAATDYSSEGISDEMAELEKKINQRFSEIKNSVGSDKTNNQ